MELVSAGGVGRERDIWTGHVTLTLVAALDDRVALAQARAEQDAHVELKARVGTCSHCKEKMQMTSGRVNKNFGAKVNIIRSSPTGGTCGNPRSF